MATATVTRRTKATTSPMLAAALKYVTQGWEVFPVESATDGRCTCGNPTCARPAKHPIAELAPHGFKNATRDPEQIKQWWSSRPDANIGVRPPSHLVIIDIDGAEARASYEKEFGWPDTRCHVTGRGEDHKHLIFSLAPGQAVRSSESKLLTKVDVRAHNHGYAIFPPSLHASGRAYRGDDSPILPLPADVFARLEKCSAMRDARRKAAPVPVPRAEITEGGRNSKLMSIAGGLRKKGLELEAIEGALLAINETQVSPPMDAKEVHRIARNACGYPPEQPEDDSALVNQQPTLQDRVSKIDAILAAMPDENLYYMEAGNRFVHAADYRRGEHERDIQRCDARTTLLRDVNEVYLRLVLSKSGKVFEYKGRPLALVPADPRQDDALAFLEFIRAGHTRQRRLRMVSSTPVLLPSGDIVSEPGYHAPSQILIRPIDTLPLDPDPGELLSADQCRSLLHRYFSTFFDECAFVCERPNQPWQETQGFAVALSGAFCIVLRNLLPCVPAHCISAPAQRSGKTLLVQLVSVLTTGTEPTAVSYDNSIEFGKTMPSIVAAGARVTLVDNIDKAVDNNRLAIALTQHGAMSWRTLGKEESKVFENATTFFFNGNQLVLTGEMPTRSVMAELDSGMERPEDREFKRPHILRDSRSAHPDAVMALLRVARAHMRAGFPGSKLLQKPMGGFAEYSEWVRGLLVWMGFADPKATQEQVRANDPGQASAEELLLLLSEAIGDSACSIRAIRDSMNLADQLRLMERTHHKPGESFSETRVGQHFHKLRNRPFGGLKLVSDKKVNNTRVWRVEVVNFKQLAGEPRGPRQEEAL